ncbi:hypothetical protein GCM10017620_03480 [Brevundimonas intermedia]|uniref:CsbD family protein n=1 Tax=Brevundimonas intermedia TaxID=74315 RepID=A0ABQ5T5I7_9CAUL|nr:hypothetical protein GCM10017620_03480 [Brevundimonas intermedia]
MSRLVGQAETLLGPLEGPEHGDEKDQQRHKGAAAKDGQDHGRTDQGEEKARKTIATLVADPPNGHPPGVAAALAK